MGDSIRGGCRRSSWPARGLAVLALALAAGAAGAETRTVVVGARYKAGGVHRFLLGTGYRDLWTAPIQVEVLDLARFSGGLVAEKKGGGLQTQTLRFEGKDGRKWKFRSVDKDPSRALPENLRQSFAEKIVQDEISASHPLGVLVADALEQAAGILHVDHRVVVLPDDERLGEFRKEFAGMLGTLEQTVSVEPPVTPGFSGFTQVADTEDLEEILDSDSGERVDARAFLRARLLDVVIGDPDRHQFQWDWARSAGTGRWVAVAKDRDLAFVRFDGLLMHFVRSQEPHLVKFDEQYPAAIAFDLQSRDIDRLFLGELDWPAWRQVADELRSRITDPVVDRAVKRLPPPYYRVDGARLAARLKARRDGLEPMARRLYQLLAREAEVYGSDQSDTVQILREADGSVEVVLTGSSGPYLQRRFLPGETREVRIFLKGGDDHVESEGHGDPKVIVRVVGGDGNDVIDDSAAGHTRVYDSSRTARVVEGPGTDVSHRPYTHPLDSRGFPARDWGSESSILPWGRASQDYGLVLGAEYQRTAFGFRKDPFAAQQTLRVGYSAGLRTAGVEYEYLSLRTDSRGRFHVAAKLSALDVIHYYGFGNETKDLGDLSLYKVKLTQATLAPSYRLELEPVDVYVGPVLKYADTRTSSLLLERQRPYGSGSFGQVGAQMGVVVDRRQLDAGRSRGGIVAAEASVYPGAWSATETFGKVRAEGVAYLPADLPLEPVLALRVGGEKLFGRYPFEEAASLGGSDSFRGLLRQRYIGDASAYANAELRVLLLRKDRTLIPRVGVFGLGDVGRVFLQGEVSSVWHTGFGGGVFLSLLDVNKVVSFTLATSEGQIAFHLQSGFSF
jgi:hypothetical protein